MNTPKYANMDSGALLNNINRPLCFQVTRLLIIEIYRQKMVTGVIAVPAVALT
jgi:hypothetical protein